jgi:hypothetical protein
VISILPITERQDVYCFTVKKYGNFVIDLENGKKLSSGVVVHNCPYFMFNNEYALNKVGSSSIKYCNGEPPKKTNPKNIPYLCKHLYSIAPKVVAKALEVSKKDKKHEFEK